MKIVLTSKKFNTGKILIKDNYQAFEKLRDDFSIMEKNFAYIKRCRALQVKISPTKEYIRKSCIKANGEFQLGMLFDILHYCKNTFFEHTLEFDLDDNVKSYIRQNDLKLDTDVIVNEKGDKPRDYQIEAMQIALNRQNGLYILGTGAGKTLCTALLIHNLLRHSLCKKILLVCPFPDLANQTYREISKNLAEHSYTFSRWFGKHKFDASSDVIICGSDILRSQFEQYHKEITSFDCVIVDEVHQLKLGNKISKVITDIPAKFRYGFTGTLPTNKLDEWAIKGLMGPVRYDLPSAQLRENKFLTPVSVLGLHVNLPEVPTFTIDFNGNKHPFTYSDEVEWLSECEELNNLILNISKKINYNSLILVNRLSQGEALKNLYENSTEINKEIYFIKGDVPIEERDDIKQLMEEKDNLILIAQVQTFSTGINVKNIHNIIFPAIIGKSNIRIIQSIGRILRLQENKEKAKVIDIIPNTKYCHKHWEERKEIYAKEKIDFMEKTIKL